MRISVINKKGGVGKTSLAYNLAIDLDLFLISNDDSVIELAYSNKAKIMDKPKLIDNVVYDFGGFVDSGVLEIVNKSDFVVVPLTADLNSFKKTMSIIKEIENENILLVANIAEKTDFEDIKSYFVKHFNFPIFEIKSARIWKKTFKEKKSVLQIQTKNKINEYVYRNAITGYIELLNYIKKGQSK